LILQTVVVYKAVFGQELSETDIMPYSTEKFHDAKVLVIGDVILDRYWHGYTSRISPEAPVPVVRINQCEERPGGAANVANNIRALGGRVTLLGVCGTDAEGQRLQSLLSGSGISHRLDLAATARTITKLRVVSQHQQLIRLDFEEDAGYPASDQLIRTLEALLSESAVVVLSDYAKGTLREAPAIIAAARRHHCAVVVDPKGSDFSRYKGATLLTPNFKEFTAVVGECADHQQLVQRAKQLCLELGLEALLVTRGEDGMTLVPQQLEAVHFPAQAREVFDVTGAGDTVAGVLGLALAAGYELQPAAALANTAAGLTVAKLGAATISAAELEEALHARRGNSFGVLAEQELLEAVAIARRRGETIVMTNGCFDMLHAGHVGYLQQARDLGDRLIVAVNDDDSVRRLKGRERPINPLAHRMTVLVALSCVDWVVPFSEDTPARLICALGPDVLTKGGDYRAEQVAGADCVSAAGGKVIILPYLEQCSTSRIIDSVRAGETS
jgi:D-beta-D-heptose 7-phosphate kinase/D-beta-D-heptose 1-phosphate adenosyltransferase